MNTHSDVIVKILSLSPSPCPRYWILSTYAESLRHYRWSCNWY